MSDNKTVVLGDIHKELVKMNETHAVIGNILLEIFKVLQRTQVKDDEIKDGYQ